MNNVGKSVDWLNDWLQEDEFIDWAKKNQLKKMNVDSLPNEVKDVISWQMDDLLENKYHGDVDKMHNAMKSGTKTNRSFEAAQFQLYAKIQKPALYISSIDGWWWKGSERAFIKYEKELNNTALDTETNIDKTTELRYLNARAKEIQARVNGWDINIAQTSKDLIGVENELREMRKSWEINWMRELDSQVDSIFENMLNVMKKEWIKSYSDYNEDVTNIQNELEDLEESEKYNYWIMLDKFRWEVLLSHLEWNTNWHLSRTDIVEVNKMMVELEKLPVIQQVNITNFDKRVSDIKNKLGWKSTVTESILKPKSRWIEITDSELSFVDKRGKREVIPSHDYDGWEFLEKLWNPDLNKERFEEKLNDLWNGDQLVLVNKDTDKKILIMNKNGTKVVYDVDFVDVDDKDNGTLFNETVEQSNTWPKENVSLSWDVQQQIKKMYFRNDNVQYSESDLMKAVSILLMSDKNFQKSISENKMRYGGTYWYLSDKWWIIVDKVDGAIVQKAITLLGSMKNEYSDWEENDVMSTGVRDIDPKFFGVTEKTTPRVEEVMFLDSVSSTEDIGDLMKDSEVKMSYQVAKKTNPDTADQKFSMLINMWKDRTKINIDDNIDTLLKDIQTKTKKFIDGWDTSARDEAISMIKNLNKVVKEWVSQVNEFTSVVDFLQWDWHEWVVASNSEKLNEVKEELETELRENASQVAKELWRQYDLSDAKQEEVEDFLFKNWNLTIITWGRKVTNLSKSLDLWDWMSISAGLGINKKWQFATWVYLNKNAKLWESTQLNMGIGTNEGMRMWVSQAIKNYWTLSADMYAWKWNWGWSVWLERNRTVKLNEDLAKMEGLAKTVKKWMLKPNENGGVADINIDRANLSREQKQIVIENLNKMLSITWVSLKDPQAIDLMRQAFKNLSIDMNKDNEWRKLDGAWVWVLFFSTKLFIPFLSLNFKEVARQQVTNWESYELMENMLAREEDAKDSMFLDSSIEININDVTNKIRQKFGPVDVSTAIVKDPSIGGSFVDWVARFNNGTPLIKEGIAIDGDKITVIYYVYNKENKQNMQWVRLLDMGHTVVNGVAWDKFEDVVQDTEVKVTGSVNVAKQYEMAKTQLWIDELYTDTKFLKAVAQAKYDNFKWREWWKLQKTINEFYKKYNSPDTIHNLETYIWLAEALMEDSTLNRYFSKINSMNESLKPIAITCAINTIANVFAVSKEISRAKEWKTWWSDRTVDFSHGINYKYLIGADSKYDIWKSDWIKFAKDMGILENTSRYTVNYRKIDDTMVRWLTMREILKMPPLWSRFEWQMNEYKYKDIDLWLTKSDYADLLKNAWEQQSHSDIIWFSVANHKWLPELSKWLVGIVWTSDYISTKKMENETAKWQMFNQLSKRWLLESVREQLQTQIGDKNTVNALLATWQSWDLQLDWDMYYGLTAIWDLSVFMKNLVVKWTVWAKSVSFKIDAWVATWVTRGTRYEETNSFGIKFGKTKDNREEEKPQQIQQKQQKIDWESWTDINEWVQSWWADNSDDE